MLPESLHLPCKPLTPQQNKTSIIALIHVPSSPLCVSVIFVTSDDTRQGAVLMSYALGYSQDVLLLVSPTPAAFDS